MRKWHLGSPTPSHVWEGRWGTPPPPGRKLRPCPPCLNTYILGISERVPPLQEDVSKRRDAKSTKHMQSFHIEGAGSRECPANPRRSPSVISVYRPGGRRIFVGCTSCNCRNTALQGDFNVGSEPFTRFDNVTPTAYTRPVIHKPAPVRRTTWILVRQPSFSLQVC